MASYALLGALSGFRYSAAQKTLWLAPRLELDTFETFFSTASGWGTLRLSDNRLTIDVCEGSLQVDQLQVEWQGQRVDLQPGLKVTAGRPEAIELF